MKNISLALNIILLVAVGFLYYKEFSESKNTSAASTVNSDSLSIAAPAVVLSELPKNRAVVFVNADSIFAKYELARKTKAITEGKAASYQKAYQTRVDAFQKEYSDYMEKAGAGSYTKEQGLAIEEGLKKKKDDIMMMEQNQNQIMSEAESASADVQKKIYTYLTRFNKEHGYHCVLAYTKTGGGVLGVNDSLDVTTQVLAGLNAEYNATKGK